MSRCVSRVCKLVHQWPRVSLRGLCQYTRNLNLSPFLVLRFSTEKFPVQNRARFMHSNGGIENTSRSHNETIFSLSSAPGKAGVSIVRVSGPAARLAVELIAPAKRFPISRMATRRRFIIPETKEHLDDGLVLWFPEPNSFTGEDVAEFHIHGSRVVLQGLLSSLASITGLRHAQPGEFTRRAFDKGKMNLIAVEGLSDLLEAETEAQRRQALSQLGGSLTRLYEGWREGMVRVLAHIEAFIDFEESEEDVTSTIMDDLQPKVQRLITAIESHLQDGRRGELLRDGLRVAILGPPNAGKSSLLNALAQRDVAIVSPVPGTTRDVLSVSLNLAGYPVLLEDTAGIRETSDLIEQEGVRRARERSKGASLKLCVFDLGTIEADLDLFKDELRSSHSILVLNKSDLTLDSHLQAQVDALKEFNPYVISCQTGQGLDELIKIIQTKVQSRFESGEVNQHQPLVTRARYREHLQDCVEALQRFQQLSFQVDLAAEELRYAIWCIGKITGRVDVEEVLDVIFKDFCIGK